MLRPFGLFLLLLVCEFATSIPVPNQGGVYGAYDGGLQRTRSAGFGETVGDWIRTLKNRIVGKWREWFGNDNSTPISVQDILNTDMTIESRGFPGSILDIWNHYNPNDDEWDIKVPASRLPVLPGFGWVPGVFEDVPEATQPPTTTSKIELTTTQRLQTPQMVPQTESVLPSTESTTEPPSITDSVHSEEQTLITQSIATSSELTSTQRIVTSSESFATDDESITVSIESISTESMETSIESNVMTAESTSVESDVTIAESTSIEVDVTTAESTSIEADVTTAESTSIEVDVTTAESTSIEADVTTAESTSIESIIPSTVIIPISTVSNTSDEINTETEETNTSTTITATTETFATSTLSLPILNKRVEDNEVDRRTTKKPRRASAEVIM